MEQWLSVKAGPIIRMLVPRTQHLLCGEKCPYCCSPAPPGGRWKVCTQGPQRLGGATWPGPANELWAATGVTPKLKHLIVGTRFSRDGWWLAMLEMVAFLSEWRVRSRHTILDINICSDIPLRLWVSFYCSLFSLAYFLQQNQKNNWDTELGTLHIYK